jgi:hypothetical protein
VERAGLRLLRAQAEYHLHQGAQGLQALIRYQEAQEHQLPREAPGQVDWQTEAPERVARAGQQGYQQHQEAQEHPVLMD